MRKKGIAMNATIPVRVAFTVRCDAEEAEQLREQAQKRRTTVANFLLYAAFEYLEHEAQERRNARLANWQNQRKA